MTRGESEGEGRGEGASQGKTPTSKSPHRYRLRVYFEDTDAGGMVYYANYLKFAERARTEMLRDAGFNHAEMVAEDGAMLVVRRCNADFCRSAHLDDELDVETRVMAVSGASIALEQTMRRAGEILVRLEVAIACIATGQIAPGQIAPGRGGRTAGRPTRLPERLRALIAIS